MLIGWLVIVDWLVGRRKSGVLAMTRRLEVPKIQGVFEPRIPKEYTTTEGWRPCLGATDKMLHNLISGSGCPSNERIEKPYAHSRFLRCMFQF